MEARDQTGNAVNGMVAIAFGGAFTEPIDQMAALFGDIAMLGRPVFGSEPIAVSTSESMLSSGELMIPPGPFTGPSNGGDNNTISVGKSNDDWSINLATASFNVGISDEGSPVSQAQYLSISPIELIGHLPTEAPSTLFPPTVGTNVAESSPGSLNASGPGLDTTSMPYSSAGGVVPVNPANASSASPIPTTNSVVPISPPPAGTGGPPAGPAPTSSPGPYPGGTSLIKKAIDPIASEKAFSSGVFRVTRIGDVSYPMTVGYTLSGTAKVNLDYDDPSPDETNRTVTILAGYLSAEVLIFPVDDGLTEDPETVRLTLTSGTYEPGGMTYPSAQITIVDTEDEAVVENQQVVSVRALRDGSESGPNATFLFTRSGANLSTPLTVTYTLGGTATSDVDYLPIPGSVTFPAFAPSVTVQVAPIDDLEAENSETVTVQLTAGAGYAIGWLPIAGLTISDNDGTAGPVGVTTVWVRTTADAAEPGLAGYGYAGGTGADGAFNFIRFGGDISQPLTVSYSIAGTATANTDYQSLTGQVTFAAYSLIETVLVKVINDWQVEPEETVIATITPTSPFVLSATGPAIVRLIDDDNVYGGGYSTGGGGIAGQFPDTGGAHGDAFGGGYTNAGTATSYTYPYSYPPPPPPPPPMPSVTIVSGSDGAEGGANGSFTLQLSQTVSSPVTVYYSTSGTATSGSDYNLSPITSITIPANTFSVVVTTNVVNDTIPEPTESLSLSLSSVQSSASVSIGAPYTWPINIYDNDGTSPPPTPPPPPPPPPPQIWIDSTTNGAETGPTRGKFILKRDGTLTNSVMVPFSTTPFKATTPGDYSLSPSTFATFAAGSDTATVTMSVVDDAIYDPDESVTITSAP